MGEGKSRDEQIAASVDHLATAKERMDAMRRTGLAQAFTAANGAAVLAEIERLERIIAWYWRNKGPYPTDVDAP